MVSRRDFLAASLGAGAALAVAPELLRAHEQAAKLLKRAIPSTGEMLPVVGLQFGNPPPPGAPLGEILETFVDNGGTVFDTVHQAPAAEELSALAATELGVQKKVFWSARSSPAGPPQPGLSAPSKETMERSLARFKVDKIDLVMMNPLGDPGHLAAMREMKKEGRVRYLGMQVIDDRQYARLETIMRTEPIDFVGVDYSLDNRGAEHVILPLAQERKIAVMAFMPFDMGSIFKRAGTAPLPAWAAGFDAKTWAQFFLKFVISHPAVTVVRTGTSNPAHMLENINAGTGRLPDAATRKRMAELVDSWPVAGVAAAAAHAPATVAAAVLDRYAGDYKTAQGAALTVRRVGPALHLNAGAFGITQDAPLVARSETRFSDPWGAIVEFQLDAAGTVTGLVMQQGSHLKLPASRIR